MTHIPSPIARRLPALRNGLYALSLALAAATAASGATISQTQILVEDGQDMFFNFSGLGPSDGTGGTVTIASGAATRPSSDLLPRGLDLTRRNSFSLTFDEGTSQGSFSCGSGDFLTTIPGAITLFGTCKFSLVLALDGAVLDALIGDGTLNLGVLFSSGVDHEGHGDEVIVSLSYTDAGPIAPVPLPAGLPLMAGGIAALGLLARRRRARR